MAVNHRVAASVSLIGSWLRQIAIWRNQAAIGALGAQGDGAVPEPG